jgi:two-component system, chemotaxis family, chemotaxis protein CheY
MMASVLVLDDSASVRQMIKMALADKGHTIVGAANGVQGLQILHSTPFDLIITDLNMPEMDGLTFTREVRKQPSHKGVPILFVTTESREAVKQEAKSAGATGWISKPFSSEQLCRVVEKVLGK